MTCRHPITLASLFSGALGAPCPEPDTQILACQYCLIQGAHVWPPPWNLHQPSQQPCHTVEAGKDHDLTRALIFSASLMTFLVVKTWRIDSLVVYWQDSLKEKAWVTMLHHAWLLEETQKFLWQVPWLRPSVMSSKQLNHKYFLFLLLYQMWLFFYWGSLCLWCSSIVSLTLEESIHDVNKYFISKLLKRITRLIPTSIVTVCLQRYCTFNQLFL